MIRRTCLQQALPAWLVAAWLLGTAMTSPAVHASAIVLLDYTGAIGELPEAIRKKHQSGDPDDKITAFEDGFMVGHLAAETGMTKAQVLDKITQGVNAELDRIFHGIWIDFVSKTTKNAKEIEKQVKDGTLKPTKVVDFPGRTTFGPINLNTLGVTFHTPKAKTLEEKVFDKAWVFEQAIHFGSPAGFWYRKADGTERDARHPNLEEAIAVLATVTAHEVGHTFGLKHVDGTLQIPPEGNDESRQGIRKSIGMDPAKSSVMSSGGKPLLPLRFSDEHKKMLQAELGTKDEEGKHKGPRKREWAAKGDWDDHGKNTDGVVEWSLLPSVIDLSEIAADPDEDAGTDVLLPAGVTSFELTFDGPLGVLHSAFLEVGLAGVNTVDHPDSIMLAFEERLLAGALDGIDQSTDEPGVSEFFAVYVDLANFFTLAELTELFADGSVIVDVIIAEGFGETISVDSVVVDGFIPEPATLALLAGLLVPAWARGSRRATGAPGR